MVLCQCLFYEFYDIFLEKRERRGWPNGEHAGLRIVRYGFQSWLGIIVLRPRERSGFQL